MFLGETNGDLSIRLLGRLHVPAINFPYSYATHLEHHGTQHGPHFSSCALQLVDRVKLFVQTVQANGFSPVCVRLCSVRPLDVVQRALQPT